jgi:effector-binding domain-containing protein
MSQDPVIEHRDEQPYVGVRETITMTTFAKVADRMPGIFPWLAERGVQPSGAPFFRYRVIDMDGDLLVDAGVPVADTLDVDGDLIADVLPAGRYVVLSHTGHPDELIDVTAGLLRWADGQGLAWDVTPSPDGDVWGCRLEVLKTNPMVEPDMHKWETDLVFKLAD